MTLKSNGTDDGHVVTCDEFFTLEAATERCRPCSGCGENAHVKLKCTSIRDTRCECDRDHYWDAGKGRCRPCDLCPHGWGAMRACTPYRNSACRRCPSGTYSAVLSTSLACFPCTACKARQTMVQACNRIQDTVCSDNEDGNVYSKKTIPKLQLSTHYTSTPGEDLSNLVEETDHSVWPIYCALLGALVLAVLVYVTLKRWRFKSPGQRNVDRRHQQGTPSLAPVLRVSKHDSVLSADCLSTNFRDVCETKRKVLEVLLSERSTEDGRDWKGLAKELGYSSEQISCMEKKSKLKTGYSCTKQLLRDWSHREDANLLNLVSALNRLGHVTAIHILLGSHLSCCTAKSGALPSFVGHCCTSARSTNGTVPWLISLKQPFGGDIV